MLGDEEKKEYEELKSLLYTGTISQYGKRKLIEIIEKQSKEIEEAEQKEKKAYIDGTNVAHELCNKYWQDKIKAKVIEVKDKPVKDEFITASQGKLNTIIDMQSLLEKE